MEVTMNQLSEFTSMDRRTIKKRLAGLEPTGVKGVHGANAFDSREALKQCYAP